MDLPKFNFLPQEDEEEEDDSYGDCGEHIEEDEEEGDDKPGNNIINIEDINLKQDQQ
jgi:hypothetical protein